MRLERESKTGYSVSNAKFSLRPEMVESLFLLWRLTHEQKYRDRGWAVLASLQKHCRTDSGFAGLRDVYTDAAGERAPRLAR